MNDEEIKKNTTRCGNIVRLTQKPGTLRKTSRVGLLKDLYRAKDLIVHISNCLAILRGTNSVILGTSLVGQERKLGDLDAKQRFKLISLESLEMKEMLENLTTELETLRFLIG